MEISEMDYPFSFEDKMVKGIFKGIFKSITHRHTFSEKNGITEMKDVFVYKVPFGLLGKLFDRMVLRRYMKALLVKRNDCIKWYAETEKWTMLVK